MLREFLKQKLIFTIILFFSCMTFHPFSCQAWQSLCKVEKHAYWWLFSLSLSLSSPCRAWTFHVRPKSPSLSENEACDMMVRQNSWAWSNFFMFLSPLSQLMNLYVMFSCPCNIKSFITTNLNSYIAVNYVRAWRNNFYAEKIKFQDLSWNFSFQAVQIPL